ncbi:hypothetical protein LAZ67_14003339 [Cordylochernes scorpioides]|uniref:Reverse transcriptase n=1 Tax=Cordylochernes scorpioides TaxID=51811 RepID=A0ABY6L8C2_9ARAC|nr:hypothetical protein LAZ67_14003339 [Cordylochernes scorpioides]
MSQNYNCVAPEPFNFSNPGDWPKWIRRFERFRQASGLINNPENEQVNMLVYCMGDNADDILLSCKIASDQLENYGKVIECFESHFIPRRNIIYERARFNQRCQQEGEKVNEFITALHSLAEHCNFGMLHDELIRDRIVVGVRDRALSERMQLDTDLTLVKATLMAKQLESVKEQQSSLYQQDSVDQIKKMPNHIKEKKRHEPKIRQFKSNQLEGSPHGCTRCGNSNNHDWKSCPAMNSYCSKCKKKGHYAKVCRSEAINEIKSEIAFLGSVEDNSKKWIVPIKVNNRQINFKIDTGADVNVLPLQNYYQSFQRIKLEKSDKILQGPNGIPLKTVGMIHEAAADSVVDSEVEITEAATTAGKKATASLNVPNLPVVVDVAVDRAVMEAATTPAITAEKLAPVNMSVPTTRLKMEDRRRTSASPRRLATPVGRRETPQKRKQAEDIEEEEVEAEEPPKKKSKKPKSKKKEEDCYLTLQAYRTMPLGSARSREMRRSPLRHQPGFQGDARMTRSKRPRRIALHQRPHLQEMEGCRGTTKTRIQRRASLQCQPCIQDMEGQSRYLEDTQSKMISTVLPGYLRLITECTGCLHLEESSLCQNLWPWVRIVALAIWTQLWIWYKSKYNSMKKTRSNTTMIEQTHNQVPQEPTTDATVAASLRTLTLCLDQLLNRESEETITYDGDEPAAHFFSQLESQPNFHNLEPARQARKALSSLRGEPRKIAQDLALLNKTYEEGITPALKLPNNDHRARAEHLPPPWTRPHHILAVTVADNTGTHSVSSEGPTSGLFGPLHLRSTASSNPKDRLGLQVSTRPQQRRAREKPSNASFGSRTPPKLNEPTCTLNQHTPHGSRIITSNPKRPLIHSVILGVDDFQPPREPYLQTTLSNIYQPSPECPSHPYNLNSIPTSPCASRELMIEEFIEQRPELTIPNQQLLYSFKYIFPINKFNVLPLNITPVKLKIISDKVISLRPYRTPYAYQKEIQDQISQLLKHDIITPSSSPYSSPVTLVRKRDNTMRLCIDFRRVNELVPSDLHPLPLIETVLDNLSKARVFSTVDISNAYYQIPIAEESQPLLSFVTQQGQYNFKRLPFGFKSAPQIFERVITQLIHKHHLSFIAHYYDDFVIFSDSSEQHLTHLRLFFKFCLEENLQLNLKKCNFYQNEIDFLGYHITAGTYTPNIKNAEIINAIRTPINVKTLQSFLGAVNVYHKFIPEYARLRHPLNQLLKKNAKWLLLTTSNNPQANGLSERLNATITGKLKLLRLQQPKTAWTKLLPQVLQAYNHTPHSVTGFPPSYLLLGSFPLQLSEHVQNYPKIDDARELAYQRTHERHLRDKARFDQHIELPILK